MFRNPFQKFDHEEMRRSSDVLKKPKDMNKVINQRVQIGGLVILIIFGCISFRLINLQYRENDEYKVKLDNYASRKQTSSTPRGVMYDANGNVIANTIQSMNITYYPNEDVSSDEEWELAIKFTKQFGKSKYEPTDEEWKKLYILLSVGKDGKKDQGNHLLTKKELDQAMKGDITSDKADKLKLKRIKQADIDDLPADYREAYPTWLLMQSVSENESKTILANVSDEQVSYLSEHQSEFRGFEVTSGWKREYPYDKTLKDVLGNIGTIQSQDRLHYQALGYPLNDQVGISGLEQEYESLLSGTRNVKEIKYDKDGEATFNEVKSGKKGYDLQLSINMDLQKSLDGILTEVLQNAKSNQYRKYYKNAFVVLMNPQDGRVYAMSGVNTDEDGNLYPYASGTYLNANTPGSIVKGATVFIGLNEGAITKNTVFNDAPMYFQGGTKKASYRNYGPLDEIGALQKSSNVYMFNIAIKLGGGTYTPYGPLNLNLSTFDLMRRYYSMFGLGVKTGVDVPQEETGYVGLSRQAGLLLDFAIGQLDTYTPMQLAQYASTVANGGKRVKPRIVSGAYEVNDKASLVYENKAEILSVLNDKNNNLERSRLGFRTCVSTGWCGGVTDSATPYEVAAKTGTAENPFYENGTLIQASHASLIGFAPYENPNLAFACVAPNSSYSDNIQSNSCSNDIMPRVLNEFYKYYPDLAKNAK